MKAIPRNNRFIIILVVLFSGNCYTQTSERDSLLVQISNAADDTSKINLLLRFAGFFADSAAEADKYRKVAYDLSKKNNYGYGLVMSEYYKVFPLSRVSNYDEAISIAKRSTERLDSIHVIQHLDGFPLFDIRSIFALSGKQIERFQYYSEKISYYQVHGPKENLADCYHGIAGYYYYLGDYDKSIEYYLRARDIYKSFDSFGYANETSVIGKIYMEWGNPDKAEFYMKSALEEFIRLDLGNFYSYKNLGDLNLARQDYKHAIQYYSDGRHSRGERSSLIVALSQVSFASVYLQLEFMDSALCYLDSAEKIRQKENLRIIYPQGNLEIDFNYYRYFTMTRNEKNALESLEKALREARSSKYIPLILKYTNELHSYWLKQGDSLQSLQYLILAQDIQDSLNRMNTRARIASYEIEQQQQEKEHEIEQLQAQKIKQRNYYLIGGAFILLVVLAGISRFRYKRRRDDEQLKTEFKKQLAQAETKALRAQMNPHFIFNCLNSINSFVIDQKHEIASDYLIKFSKLIRLILDNSRSETISLEKELETLKLYILLESARFDNKFVCVYNIAEDVNTSTIMIPPMLLQPFVENAIWHGLMQKEGNGTIIIEIKKVDEEFLNISISDNGIGREKAAELKSKTATHKSHGLKVTSQRIDMMNKLNSSGAQVNIFDLTDDQGNATGTKVELFFPY